MGLYTENKKARNPNMPSTTNHDSWTPDPEGSGFTTYV